MDSRGPATVDEEVAALSRGADRDSLFMQASLYIPGSTDPVVVRVRNLSVGGMLAEGAARVAQGTAVEVVLQNVGSVAGRIIWVGDGKFGIAFDRPVDPQMARRKIAVESDLPPHLRRTGTARAPNYRRR